MASDTFEFRKLLADPKFQGSTPGAAMVKWLQSNPNLTAVIATRNFDQFRENAGAAASVAMAPQDHCLPTCSREIDIAAKLKDVHRLLG